MQWRTAKCELSGVKIRINQHLRKGRQMPSALCRRLLKALLTYLERDVPIMSQKYLDSRIQNYARYSISTHI